MSDNEITINGEVYVKKSTIEKQPERNVPPKGWPVWVKRDYYDEWFIKVSDGELDEFGQIKTRDAMIYIYWKPYTLPDGRELSPENFGKGHKIEAKLYSQRDTFPPIKYCVRIDGGCWFGKTEGEMKDIAGDKFNTIGNEWVEV